MDIKILDSWLREHLETNAKPKDIAKVLSLTSASVERIDTYKKDLLYTLEITTNRPDMVSVRGIAREAATVLPQCGFTAKLLPLHKEKLSSTPKGKFDITISNDPTLVRRICAVILDVTIAPSPEYIQQRLDAAGIRSINNVIDITNYLMLEIGHPCHAFDYDTLTTKKIIIRQSKKGESLTTLDGKTYTLLGGDIVADNGEGEIIDLLGIMGTQNSAVTPKTKRILLFLDNNDPIKIRKTSMGLSLRTNAATLNEKGVDPELAMDTLLHGIALYQKVAHANMQSEIVDIYPGKIKSLTLTVTNEKIQRVLGVPISIEKSITILQDLGFLVKQKNSSLLIQVPSWREKDVTIEEDIIEEVARMYGYHNLPSVLPPFEKIYPYHVEKNEFYWEQKTKDALRYWGFTEVYTYSLVPESGEKDAISDVVRLSNPLDKEHVSMRISLTPSLQQVVQDNKTRKEITIFELSNTYHKQTKKLPSEIRTLGILIKSPYASFYLMKGIVEQIAYNMGLAYADLLFKNSSREDITADIYIRQEKIGHIALLDTTIWVSEINFDSLLTHANTKKTYIPLAKYPPIIEDLSLTISPSIATVDVIHAIKDTHTLITTVSLLDQFNEHRTFHITYQHPERNLVQEEVTTIRESILSTVGKKFHATIVQ